MGAYPHRCQSVSRHGDVGLVWIVPLKKFQRMEGQMLIYKELVRAMKTERE